MNIWNLITAKLYKWYKGHDGVADAHHTPYTDNDANGAMEDPLNPCTSVHIDSSNLGAVGNHLFRISPTPAYRNELRFDDLTTGQKAVLAFRAFEVNLFAVSEYARAHKNGVGAPYWFTWFSGESGQLRLWNIGSINFEDDALLRNLKNHTASGLSGTQKDIEIDIGGVSYYFTVYPTKA